MLLYCTCEIEMSVHKSSTFALTVEGCLCAPRLNLGRRRDWATSEREGPMHMQQCVHNEGVPTASVCIGTCWQTEVADAAVEQCYWMLCFQSDAGRAKRRASKAILVDNIWVVFQKNPPISFILPRPPTIFTLFLKYDTGWG